MWNPQIFKQIVNFLDLYLNKIKFSIKQLIALLSGNSFSQTHILPSLVKMSYLAFRNNPKKLMFYHFLCAMLVKK